MDVTLRPARPDDAQECGRICYDAFAAIADAHNFTREFPSVDIPVWIAKSSIERPGFYAVVAESDGRVVGSNFLDERSVIRGVGPISVDPAVQDASVGRRLMEDVMQRADTLGAAGIRLVQVAYHNRSFSLYAKLGFHPREQLACVNGNVIAADVDGYDTRPATAGDVDACNAVCRVVHGFDRGMELEDTVREGSALVVEHGGAVVGYATGIGIGQHAVATNDDAMKALIAAPSAYQGAGFLVPTTNADLLRWCLANGLRVVQLMTLMTIGLYNEPAGSYLPSVLF